MDITLIDDSWDDNGYLTSIRLQNPSAVTAGTVADAVSRILSRLGSRDSIHLFRIVGHGLPGLIGMGEGEGNRVWDHSRAICIDEGGHLANRADLARLRGRFSAHAVVELHGCNVGLNHSGRELCRQLSDLWSVPVRAGVETQYPDASLRFIGPIVEARPGQHGHHSRIHPDGRGIHAWEAEDPTIDANGQNTPYIALVISLQSFGFRRLGHN